MAIKRWTKICSKCGERKSINEFYRNSNGRGLFGCRGDCKTCVNAISAIRVAEWRIANPGRRDKSDKKYRAANIQKCREATRTSIRKKPEYYNEKTRTWRENNPEKVKAINRRYKRKNKDKVNIRNANRRAREKLALGQLSLQQWETIKEMYGYRCVYCYSKVRQPVKEHIVPIVSGGRHDISNVVPACISCNSKKGAKSLLSFLSWRLNFEY